MRSVENDLDHYYERYRLLHNILFILSAVQTIHAYLADEPPYIVAFLALLTIVFFVRTVRWLHNNKIFYQLSFLPVIIGTVMMFIRLTWIFFA